jgi:cytochrome bd-type quinol oxidase subunit 2
MRAVRLLAATLNVVIGGYLLLIANGISVAMQDRALGWHITPVPSRPVARIVVYVTVAIALQLGSAWLLMPATERDAARLWGQYAARVALCIGGCFVAAFVLLFLVMALLDAGVI